VTLLLLKVCKQCRLVYPNVFALLCSTAGQVTDRRLHTSSTRHRTNACCTFLAPSPFDLFLYYSSWLLCAFTVFEATTALTQDNVHEAVDLYDSNETAAIEKYGEIKIWDVSNITDMSSLFLTKRSFNANISAWNVSKVTRMDGMFNQASAFNQDISAWDVSKVTRMDDMFNRASAFNQDISA
jgi:surface protein